jgi:ribosomal protein L29
MKEYLNKTMPDLSNLLVEKRAALRDFRFGSTGGKEKNVKTGRNLRTEIARIMTTFSAKAGEAAKAANHKRTK